MAAAGYRTGLECRAMPGETAGTAREAAVAGNGGTRRADGARGHLRRPAHAGADDDLLQPRLDRGLLPRRPARRPRVRAGAARGLRRRDGHRLRARARRAGLRPAAHHRRASATPSPRWPPRASTARRWWSWSASRTAATSPRSPSSPAACDGLAGEYPVSVDQPVRAQDVPGALVRAYHAAATAPRPRARDRADGRLARAGARGPRGASAPSACCAPAPRRPRRSTSSPRCSTTRGRPPSSSAPAPTRRRAGPRSWRSPSTSSCPVFTEAFGARAGFPQDHPLFAGHLSPSRARLREMLAPHDAILAVGAPIFRQYAYEPGPLVDPGHAPGARHRRPRRGAPQPVAADDPGRAERGLPRPGRRALSRARRPAARAVRPGPPRRRRRRPASRCAPATSSPRSPSACRPTRSWSRSRPRAAPSCTPASRPARRWASSAPRWAASASRCPGTIGAAHGAARPPVLAVLGDGSSLYADPGAVERGALPRRRAVRRHGQRPLRDHGQAGRRTPASRRRGRPSTRSTSPRSPRAQGCEAIRDRGPRRPARARSTRCCRRWRSATPRCCSRSPSRPDAQAGGRRADHAGARAP